MTTLSPPPGFGGLSSFSPQHSPQQSPYQSPEQSPSRSPSQASEQIELSLQQSRQESPQQSQQPLQQLHSDTLKRSRDNRVSFATGDNFCQIRLFLAEDPPILSGSVQELLQGKPARNLHIVNSVSRVQAFDAPPGFGGMSLKPMPDCVALAAIVPQVPWRPPSVFNLDPTWHVMAGVASLEVGCQSQREVRVLEAVYPRPSSIPYSPAEPMEAQETYDDSKTPQIPLVPLEEEDTPEVCEPSITPVGPRVSQGLPGQVNGAPPLPPNRSEKAKFRVLDSLPGSSIQEISHVRKETSWRESASQLGRSSDPLIGRPSLAAPPPYLFTKPNHNPLTDDSTGTTAAYAAISKSQEVGSMIDNELLMKILSDPSLIHSRTTKSHSSHPNTNSDVPSSTGLNVPLRGTEKMNQLLPSNAVTNIGNAWTSMSSMTYPTPPGMGEEASKTRIGEIYANGIEKFQRTALSDDRSSNVLPISMGSKLTTEPANGRVVSGTGSRPVSNSDAPPGFGVHDSRAKSLLGYDNKSAPRLASQSLTSQVGVAPARPLSRQDVQYYKSLIMQHGCKSADDDDHGRAVVDSKLSTNVRTSSAFNLPEMKRWFSKEDTNDARVEKSKRDMKESEKYATLSSLEKIPRTKSRKVCIYYGTARGCRNGDSCTFVHEISDSDNGKHEKLRNAAPPHLQYSKRLKVDG